jgi:hypothetical protein
MVGVTLGTHDGLALGVHEGTVDGNAVGAVEGTVVGTTLGSKVGVPQVRALMRTFPLSPKYTLLPTADREETYPNLADRAGPPSPLNPSLVPILEIRKVNNK